MPCLAPSESTPETPNLSKLSEILAKFSGQNVSNTNTSVVNRVTAKDLCTMSESIMKFLPTTADDPNGQQHNSNIVSHFSIIKKFYEVYQNIGFDPSPSMDLFFNSLQIYESVMSVAFVVFEEHPDVLGSISDIVNKAIKKIENNKTKSCFALALCGAAILSQFDSILASIDHKVGELGLVKIAEFVSEIIEVFCNFFHIDLNDTNKIESLSKSIETKVNMISSTLRTVFGDSIPAVERATKWGPLGITEKIRAKLSKFEKHSTIVNRTLTSFDSLFKEIEKIDDGFQSVKVNQQQQQQATPLSDSDIDVDVQKVETQALLQRQIDDQHLSSLEQINIIGRFFQQLDTILSYGILIFKNEDEVLNPLLDQVDECTRILRKFLKLHPLYKIITGKNYLSKLNQIVHNIVTILDNSNLKINSPKEFMIELQEKYPNLLFLVAESILQDKIKFLPDDVKKKLGFVFDGPLANFQNLDITNPEAVGNAIGNAMHGAAGNLFKKLF